MNLDDPRVLAALEQLIDKRVEARLAERESLTRYGFVFGPPDTANRTVAVRLMGQSEPTPGIAYDRLAPQEGDYVRVMLAPLGNRYVDAIISDAVGGTEYSYNGQVWVSNQIFIQTIPTPLFAAPGFLGQAAPPVDVAGIHHDIWMLDLLTTALAYAPNNATNYWIWSFSSTDAGVLTDIGGGSSQGYAAGLWVRDITPINAKAIHAGVGVDAWRFWCNSVGAPGGLQLGASVSYRLIRSP